MVELSGNPEELEAQSLAVAPVDLVIGFVDPKAGEDLTRLTNTVKEGLSAIDRPQRIAILYKGTPAPDMSLSNGNGAGSVRLMSYAPAAADPSATLAQAIYADYRTIATEGGSLEPKAYVLIATEIEAVTPEWIYRLAEPIVEHTYDLVSPCYTFHKFEGVLNNAILYPLTRSLYGKRIVSPLGPDVGVSAFFLQQLLQVDQSRPRHGVMPRTSVPIGAEAASRGLRICQVNLGERSHLPVDWKNLSSLLADILGPLFQTMERDAPIWQRVRGSEPIPTMGPAVPAVDGPAGAVDVRRLLEPFQLGFRNLQEIWALLLPPKTIFELQRIGKLPPEQFRIPDDLWARIIYDFSLGYHLRTLSRDHVLRALTPIYLGWVASYAIEAEAMSPSSAQNRIEKLCEAYEAAKPYLVSRWRWPDRFNP